MKYCSIASGSNGNSYYIAKGDDAILVDIGLNCKHMELRMSNLNLDPHRLKAIFITHEHTDHIRGLAVFTKRYKVPVFLTQGTYEACKIQLPADLVNIIPNNGRVNIGQLTIFGIPKYHDAKDPCSFLISDGTVNIGVLTDIGRCCENVRKVVVNSDVLILEANYDEEMLRSGGYPYFLKNRIQGGWGHLSNIGALQLFNEYRTTRLKHLILSHLSGQNNTVDRVYEMFEPCCGKIKLSIATREKESEFFSIDDLLLRKCS